MTNKQNIYEAFGAIAFNPYKHHLNFLRKKTEAWKERPWTEAENEIKLIGDNLIDMYYGQLSVNDICKEISTFTINNYLTAREQLTEWLRPYTYRKVELSDGSFWVIREGQETHRFIHIHPGKHAPLTIRVKAPVLKTVIALKVCGFDLEHADLRTINQVRTEKLHLSPIKKVTSGKGIARLMADFNSL